MRDLSGTSRERILYEIQQRAFKVRGNTKHVSERFLGGSDPLPSSPNKQTSIGEQSHDFVFDLLPWIRYNLPLNVVFRNNVIHKQDLKNTHSLTWMFAVNSFSARELSMLTGLSNQKIQTFSIKICNQFYIQTNGLLKKAKNGKMDTFEEDWASLEDHLKILYFVAADHLNLMLLKDCDTKDQLQEYRLRSPNLRMDYELRDLSTRWTRSGSRRETTRNAYDSLKIQKGFVPQCEGAMSQEKLEHLREYAEHWLGRLKV